MSTDRIKAIKKRRPRVIDLNDQCSFWVHTDDELVYLDVVNCPLLGADEAERAAKWLLRFATWKRQLTFERASADSEVEDG